MAAGGAPHLDLVDLSQRISRAEYDTALTAVQLRLAQLQQAYMYHGLKAVIVFEGWDAAGKGSTIRRISQALDPRSFKVWPIGAPRNYYLERHYLLRFMERMPPAGAISAFDRSWYGRVMVERVEQLTPEHRWRGAYDEIIHFERMLVDDNTRLVKLFFHISPDVQLSRFEERLSNPVKRWKLTVEDFRNRAHRDATEEAVNDMFARTSWDGAPWHVIPANQKKFARIAAIRIILDELSAGVDLGPPPLPDDLLEVAQAHLSLDRDFYDGLSAGS